MDIIGSKRKRTSSDDVFQSEEIANIDRHHFENIENKTTPLSTLLLARSRATGRVLIAALPLSVAYLDWFSRCTHVSSKGSTTVRTTGRVIDRHFSAFFLGTKREDGFADDLTTLKSSEQKMTAKEWTNKIDKNQRNPPAYTFASREQYKRSIERWQRIVNRSVSWPSKWFGSHAFGVSWYKSS